MFQPPKNRRAYEGLRNLPPLSELQFHCFFGVGRMATGRFLPAAWEKDRVIIFWINKSKNLT